MTLMKKLNRGAILSLAAILGVIVYLLVNAALTAVEVGRIKAVCADYLALETAYALLPAGNRQDPDGMTPDEQEQYVADMESALRPLLVEGDVADQKLLDMENALRLQMSGTGVIEDFKKSIARFDAVNINQDVAVVTITAENTYDGPTVDVYSGLPGNSRLVESRTDTLVLQRVEGVWKVYGTALYNPWPFAADYSGSQVIG